MFNRALAALALYAEPIIASRRVLLIGSASMAERLSELGARSVHVYEPVASGTEPGQGVTVQALPDGDFDVRDGAFDLALVPELDDVRDPAVLLARLRRVLGPDGVAIVATARVSDDDYYRLYDAVALQFATVVMLAEVPFEGITIAQLGGDEDVEVSVDTQLAPSTGSPMAFVAVASRDEVALSPYSIIGVPPERAPDSFAPAALAEARLRADVQGSQLEEERAQRHQLEREVNKLEDALAAERAARASAERAALSADELMAARERIAVLESSLQIAEETSDRIREQLDVQADALQKKAEETLVLLAEVDALQSAPPPSDPSPDLRRRIEELEEDLAGLGEAHAQELSALEDRLRERAATIATLEREIRHRERIAQELLTLVEEASTETASGTVPDDSAQLRTKLDEVALVAARRESELLARSWRIAELESRLVKPTKAPKSALEDEVLALRQALAQEHEARARAESGEELAKARAELERQAVLLAQLGAELEHQDARR